MKALLFVELLALLGDRDSGEVTLELIQSQRPKLVPLSPG